MHLKQLIADVQVLVTLGFLAGLVVCATVAIIGGISGAVAAVGNRTSRAVPIGYKAAKWALVAVCILAAGYGATVLAASLASRDVTLTPGQEKYFCEVDCHLAYAVTDVRQSKVIGTGPLAAKAQGTFYIVTIRTRFDEKTISPERGNSPLKPSPRRIALEDSTGRRYEVSADGEHALESFGEAGTSLDTPLPPGDSYFSCLAFDVPEGAPVPRVLVESPANPQWMGWISVGDEQSFLHKRVYLQLPRPRQ